MEHQEMDVCSYANRESNEQSCAKFGQYVNKKNKKGGRYYGITKNSKAY